MRSLKRMETLGKPMPCSIWWNWAVAFFSANVLIVIVSAAVIGIAATLIARKAGKKL